MTPRYARFAMVGALGLVIQLAALWTLTRWARWSWPAATIAAVELAVVHNYWWHVHWTWGERRVSAVAGFVRFQLVNGVASLAGNGALMALFAGTLRLPPLAANVLAVTVMAVVNFLAADRWVFRRGALPAVTLTLTAVCGAIPAVAAAQPVEAIAAWNRYVATAEGRPGTSWPDAGLRVTEDVTANGASVRLGSGTISDWRGTVLVPGVTLDQLLHRLQYPGTPPPQEDVVASRVIARSEDGTLRVAIRLVRHAIVTVAYDTEHEMRFHRETPTVATARSVATRIEEIGGTYHGFLWRLNSYWRYEQVAGGVRVDLRSLTLSRDVPALVRPIAAPLVNRIARESVVRTLAALQRFATPEDAKVNRP